MGGQKAVDMRQHSLHSAAARLEPVEAQQRVEPEQLRTGPMQPVDLEGKIAALVPVKAVGDQRDAMEQQLLEVIIRQLMEL